MNNFGSIYWVVILGKKFSRFWVEDFLSVLSFSPEKNFFRGSDKYNVSKPKLEIIFCNSDRCNVRFENEAPSLSATLLSAFQKPLLPPCTTQGGGNPLDYTSGSHIRVQLKNVAHFMNSQHRFTKFWCCSSRVKTFSNIFSQIFDFSI